MSSDPQSPYWKSLLAISTAVTNKEEENEVCTPRVLDEGNRKWLEQVMSDLVKDTDPSLQLKHVMKSLHCYAAGPDAINEEDVEKIEELVERLEDLLQYSFLTSQFVNDGGIVMIRQFLEKHCDSLQCSFAQCILTLTENNPPAQHAVIDAGLLEYILNCLRLETTSSNEKLKYKYLGSISGTVRSDEAAFEKFVALQGHEILAKLAESDNHVKVSDKAARILTSIAYTLQDSKKFADFLLPFIISSYYALIKRSPDGCTEQEYIREFFEQYMPKEKVPPTSRNILIEALKMEHHYKDEAQITNLLKRYE